MTSTTPSRWYADRTLALVGYALLFSSIFFAGLTGLVAVILAYAVREAAPPAMRRHFDRQIGIFWTAVVLSLLATATGIAGAVVLVNDGVSWSLHKGLLPDEIDSAHGLWLIGLLGGSILLWLATGAWLVCASALGFIRLATAGTEA